MFTLDRSFEQFCVEQMLYSVFPLMFSMLSKVLLDFNPFIHLLLI